MAVKLGVLLLAGALASVGVLVLMGDGPAPLLSDTVYVSWTGDCGGNSPCVTTIGDALTNVSADGTIIVLNGTYVEALVVNVPVTIRGEGREVVTVSGGGSAPAVFRIATQNVTLEALTIADGEYGVEAQKTQNVALKGLRITNVTGGVLADGVDDFVLEGSDIVGVLSDDAVLISSSRNVAIGSPGNQVSDNGGRGIVVSSSREVVIAENVIQNNVGTGLNVSYSVNVTVADNIIEGNGGTPTPFGGAPAPLQGGPKGGLWFWETDPTSVEDNVVTGNTGFGIEIGGQRSTDFVLRGNSVRDNDGPGLVLTQGPSRLDIAGEFSGNRGHGIAMDNATDVVLHDALVEGNLGFGVRGERSVNVGVRDSRIADNAVPVPFAPPDASPMGGPAGGLWFWETDPSEIRGNTISGNGGAGVTLVDTLDFDVVDNVIEGNSGEGILLMGVNRTLVTGNRIVGGGSPGTALLDVQNVVVEGNAYADLDLGILVRDGCHIRIGANSFTDVAQALSIEGSPCDFSLAGFATVRFTPETLNMKSQGQYVMVRFEVEGLDPATFDLASVSFTVNGVALVPPPGSPSSWTVHKGVIQAMVKLDRAEAIAAFGAPGTHTVTVSGELLPGVFWSGSDTVDVILP